MTQLTKVAKSVESYLNGIQYDDDSSDYKPSAFALEFVTFIKMVNGVQGEEHKTPVVHYKMLDQIAGTKQNILNMCSRGLAKTTIMGEYLFLYIGVYGSIPGFGKVDLALYVSDSMENGVKNMRKNLEYRWENSEFLQQYIPNANFTDVRWEFNNIDGNKFVVKGYGAKTGVRGSKEMGKRPNLAVLDDLVSDDDARSPTVIASIEDTVYKAIDYALHPTKSKTIWSGTPFNAKDPLYKAVESGAWYVSVYPVCEKFPVSESEFKGAWEDRFTYKYVKAKYDKAFAAGKIDTFNQELMLRIMSDEDRLIQDDDIKKYSRASLIANKQYFNFYITTDFATTEQESGDFSVISVWATNHNGDWFWVDGVCRKQLMDANIDDLFKLCRKWKPQEVGIEVSGQQGGFIQWIENEMITRNCFFNLASDNNGKKAGIRPTTNKMQRFMTVLPQFKQGKFKFPVEGLSSPEMLECMEELTLASKGGFKSKHDDFIDTISMLTSMNVWLPSDESEGAMNDDTGVWEMEEEDDDYAHSSYVA